jgi:tetratricopeptide (TPR) repeat protein
MTTLAPTAADALVAEALALVEQARAVGRAHLVLGEADLALESFRKVVSLASTSEHYALEADAVVELAELYETRGNPREALVAMRSALRVKDEIVRSERRQLEEA